MDYFELYGIQESFTIDPKALKNKFYELSKRYHPDFYANESEAKQQDILELSTVNNKAYQVLSNPAKRTEYILQQHNLISEGEKYQLSPDFLMEMMDINENLTEAETEQDINTIKAQLAGTEQGLDNELARLVTLFETDRQTALKGIKDIYYRQKYLLRIKDSLNTFASRL